MDSTQARALADEIDGELHCDDLHRRLYAQDASVFQEQPQGVVFPRSTADVRTIVEFAGSLGLSLIPRGAGTSLAGQCVGNGLVVDLGRHMNQILEVDVEQRWVRVQPGVILDDLNRHLAQYDLFFGPDTSTSNRCMIGGMIGNNSCGSHSVYYGQTRDHLRGLGVVFADGQYEWLEPWEAPAWSDHLARQDRLGEGLRAIAAAVGDNAELIAERYPRPEVVRRNTGYPFDTAVESCAADRGEAAFSLPKFLCGTEGTLALTTEAKLNLVERPADNVLVCVHFESVRASLEATLAAVEHDPAAVELMDRPVLELTKHNLEQRRNRFFVQGDPEAILVVEFYADSVQQARAAAERLIDDFRRQHFGYAFPVVWPPDDQRVWSLRKAGLGLLMGAKGDTKPVTVVEDTAVAVDVLPDYVDDFSQIMDRHGTRCVYYAHASVGELHLRPELNLKDRRDAARFKEIAADVADLVREYGGALSGEHGDGRLRAPLLERFYGQQIMDLHRRVKEAFDPQGVFNPHKIVDPGPIDDDWRFEPGQPVPQVDTVFDWSDELGLVRAVENCNGAGVCRKRAEAGGTMCPSYMATLEEVDSTRGRANIFRQALYSSNPQEAFTDEDLHSALDLCLSCKGCTSECPANVDMARLKAEFTQQYHDAKGTPLSARAFGYYGRLSQTAAVAPWLANFLLSFFLSRWIARWLFGISRKRTLPAYASSTFTDHFDRYRQSHPRQADAGGVWLYVDPFTEYTDPEVAMAAVRVLEAGGYGVDLLPVDDDGRTFLSKGLVRQAKALTRSNMGRLEPLLAEYPDRPIIGIEPSALLTFCDEAPDLCGPDHGDTAAELARRAVLFSEFVAEGCDEGRFGGCWSDGPRAPVVLHGHCHQKALVGVEPTERALRAAGYEVDTLPTGCCGMAGSFGYEHDHYEVSMDIGELVLFPSLRQADDDAIVCAPGTSCRHQIDHGVDRTAHHPAVLLDRALG